MWLRPATLVVLGAIIATGSSRRVLPAETRVGDNSDTEDSPGSSGEYSGDRNEKYFQEIYMLQAAPNEMEFGHVREDPNNWEQRYEKKDFHTNRHQGKFPPNSYQHLPGLERYQFGFRRGNDAHARERYEKADAAAGQFTTEVRWADKDGGHGEHYWDYNHAGPSDDEEGDHSNSIPPNSDFSERQHSADSANSESRVAKTTTPSREAQDFLKSFDKEIAGLFHFGEGKRHSTSAQGTQTPTINFRFFLNPLSGRVFDKATGSTYVLQPYNNTHTTVQ